MELGWDKYHVGRLKEQEATWRKGLPRYLR